MAALPSLVPIAAARCSRTGVTGGSLHSHEGRTDDILLMMIEILHDLIYQKHRSSGSIVHIYIYICKPVQDFYHQPYR